MSREEEACYLFFVMGALNILCTLIIPALKEKRESKYRIRAINKRYFYNILFLGIEKKERQKSFDKTRIELEKLIGKNITYPNNLRATIPAPEKIF